MTRACGDRSPEATFGKLHLAALLPLAPISYRLASALGRTVAALAVGGGGGLCMAVAYRLPSEEALKLPSVPMWWGGTLAVAWGFELLCFGLGLTGAARARWSMPARTLLRPLALALARMASALLGGLRLREAIARLETPEAGWLPWLCLPLGAFVAALLVGGVWALVAPSAAGSLLSWSALASPLAGLVAAALWPGFLRAAPDPRRLGRSALHFETLLPRPALRLWPVRYAAAALLLGLAAALPWALAVVCSCFGVTVAQTPALEVAPRVAARLSLFLLCAWPLVPILAVPVRLGRQWLLRVAFWVGLVAAILPLDVLEGVWALGPLLVAALVVTALSLCLCEMNRWPGPAGQLRHLGADVLAFLVGLLPGALLLFACCYAFVPDW